MPEVMSKNEGACSRDEFYESAERAQFTESLPTCYPINLMTISIKEKILFFKFFSMHYYCTFPVDDDDERERDRERERERESGERERERERKRE